jgi:hypothetical protein
MVKVREGRWDDYDAIVSLLRRNGLTPKPYIAWQRLWLENPLVMGRGMLWPIGWVLEEQTGKIVGHLGNIPMAYEFLGNPLVAAVASYGAVDIQYRSNSLRLISNFFSQPKVDLFLDTTASYEAGVVFRGFRGRRVPNPEYDQALLAITGPWEFGQGVFRKKGWPLPGFMGGLAGLALRVVDIWRGSLKPKQLPDKFRVIPRDSFDSQFDYFWQQLRVQRRKLLFLRDQKNMEWHFGPALNANRGWLSICAQEEKMMGYAVYVMSDIEKIGLKIARLADIQALGDHWEAIMLSLLSNGLKVCGEKKIHGLEVVGFDEEKRQVIRKITIWQRKLPVWNYYYKAKDNNLSELLKDPKYWDPSIIDGDASL